MSEILCHKDLHPPEAIGWVDDNTLFCYGCGEEVDWDWEWNLEFIDWFNKNH